MMIQNQVQNEESAIQSGSLNSEKIRETSKLSISDISGSFGESLCRITEAERNQLTNRLALTSTLTISSFYFYLVFLLVL